MTNKHHTVKLPLFSEKGSVPVYEHFHNGGWVRIPYRVYIDLPSEECRMRWEEVPALVTLEDAKRAIAAAKQAPTGVISYEEAVQRKCQDDVVPASIGPMMKISDLIGWLQQIHTDFGDTCVYARKLCWGAEALNTQEDESKALSLKTYSPFAKTSPLTGSPITTKEDLKLKIQWLESMRHAEVSHHLRTKKYLENRIKELEANKSAGKVDQGERYER